MKKITFILFPILVLLAYLFFLPTTIGSQENVTLDFFYSTYCPHCAKEKVFLEKIEGRYQNLQVNYMEVSQNIEIQNKYENYIKKLGIKENGVPLLVINQSDYIIGYYSDEVTGEIIIKKVEKLLGIKNEEIKTTHTLPLLGEVNLKNLSLPVLTLVIAALDGFNPCAMWTLLFLISLLLGMKDRRRMWVLGTAFIVSSAFVYFLFLAAWLNLFIFLQFTLAIRIIVGVVALGGGGYYLYQFLVDKEGGCNTTGGDKRQKVFQQLKKLTEEKSFLVALAGIILLAFAVNLVEVVCSAGLPAVYTQVLAINNLPPWQYYLYLVFYITIFMLDDLLVFFVAMISLKAVGVNSKYSRYSRLIGGVVMLIIGLLMIFKPQLLTFA